MSDLNEKLLDVVKQNLTGIELDSIKQLIADAAKVPDLEKINQEYRASAEGQRTQSEADRTERDRLRERLNEAEAKIKSMESDIFDARVAAKAGEIIAEDRDKLFDILGSSLKHYTQTTTRQIQLKPQFEGDQSHLDHAQYPAKPHVQELTETITKD